MISHHKLRYILPVFFMPVHKLCRIIYAFESKLLIISIEVKETKRRKIPPDISVDINNNSHRPLG